MSLAGPKRWRRDAKAVRQYLARHAEPEAAGAPDGQWDVAVVVPLYDEAETVDALLATLHAAARAAQPRRALVIAVVNARDDASPAIHVSNQATLSILRQAQGPLTVHVVDRASTGRRFPPGQGVGLARKIGCDIALALWADGRLASPWIRTTDGDARVPPAYLAAERDAGEAALLYPFAHPRSLAGRWAPALTRYELSLRYYVLGLAAARSPYAFHTVGSTIAVHAGAYAAVRGFPRRDAAEDFYLLNKLAKAGPIRALAGAPIALVGRGSVRVPFGTGRATSDIQARLDEGVRFTLYDPRVFEGLARWIAAIDDAARHRSARRFKDTLEGADDESAPALGELAGAWRALQRILDGSPSDERVRERLHEAFDAFRTMRLIHTLRDRVWPARVWVEALHEAPFVSGRPEHDGAGSWNTHLQHLEAQVDLSLSRPGDRVGGAPGGT